MAVDQATGDLLVLDRDANTLSRWHSDGSGSDFSSLSGNVISGIALSSLSAHNPGEVQVAVDNSCALHEPPLSELTTPTCEEFDPANGDIYVAEFSAARVGIFAEDGSSLGHLTEYNDGGAKALELPCGVAVDPSGNVYVGDLSGKIHKYEPAANPPVNADNSANFPFVDDGTIAAGAGPMDGFIFPVHFNGGVAKLESSAPGAQKYVVDPTPTTTATVDPATGTLFTASGSEVKEFDVSGATEATPGLPIPSSEGKVGGIAVDGASGRIYIARKGNPHIEVWGRAVQLPIAITENASVVNGKVTLHGAVNANGGPDASCVFQYVEVEAFKAEGFKTASSVPCSPAGPFTGTSSEAVSAEISGLPEAAYRYRLLAENEDGSKAGEALLFDTFERVGLPDGRAYEMVSPPQKAGEVIPPEPVGQLGVSCDDCLPGINNPLMPMQSTPDGESVLYLGQPFTAGLTSGANEYLAPRSSSGWGTQGLSSPTMTGQFVAFSADLSRGVLFQAEPTLSPEAPIRGGKGFANLYLLQGGVPQPLITAEPPDREPGDFNVLFGAANAGTAQVPAFGHLAFEADDALTAADPGTAPAAPEVEAGECTLGAAECDLYEWEGGELRLVNVLPGNGAVASGAVIGSGRMLTGANPGQEPPDVAHAISDDGSRIFWSAEETGQVYVRVGGEETLEIPGPGSCKKSVPLEERACFLTASPDGSTVLLSDGSLYELNEAGSAYVASADLSEGEGGFQGILGAAENLSRVYFIDTKALTEEENDNEEEAEAGKFNLYGWDEGELTFIGRLASGDKGFGVRSYGAWAASPSQRTAQVSADGAQLAFMSVAQLTGYDNTPNVGGSCSGGSACREVFVYSADSETLSCASCNPSGEQPLGPSNLSLIRPDASFRQPGNLSRDGSGRIFFESQDALSPGDTNGHIQDVYEWEPGGVGSCKREGGCVYLISSGQSPNDSMFVDSSEKGEDAFFITREQLLRRDENQQLDLYDARVGGGFGEPGGSPCSPEGCAGPLGSPPVQASAGSAGFAGPGNPNPQPKHCKAGFVKKHGKCVKKHKKHPAGHNRGGSK